MEELNIPQGHYYESIEDVFSGNPESNVTIKATRLKNMHYDEFYDFHYVLFFETYTLHIYKGQKPSIYYVMKIEMHLDNNESIKRLLPNYSFSEFGTDGTFGVISEFYSNDQEIAYETNSDFNFLKLGFANGEVEKIELLFNFP